MRSQEAITFSVQIEATIKVQCNLTNFSHQSWHFSYNTLLNATSIFVSQSHPGSLQDVLLQLPLAKNILPFTSSNCELTGFYYKYTASGKFLNKPHHGQTAKQRRMLSLQVRGQHATQVERCDWNAKNEVAMDCSHTSDLAGLSNVPFRLIVELRDSREELVSSFL